MVNVYCEYCDVYIHKNSAWKHNKSEKHINNLRYGRIDNYNDLIEIPHWMFKEKRIRQFVNPYRLKKPLSGQYNVILIHHNVIDLNSELKVFGKANQYINKYHINNIVKQLSIKYGELINQFKFKIRFFANVKYLLNHEDEAPEEANHYIGVDIIHILTRLQLDDIDIMTDLDNEIESRDMEGSGWNVQGINHLKIYFHKTNPINGMTYIDFPIRTNAILNIQNNDSYCFLWSILASIHPVNKNPQRVSKYEPYRNELNINNIDFSNGMKIIDIPKFENLNNQLSINVFEYSTDEDNDYKLVPLYISKNIQNRRIIDLILYKNHYILLKKLHVFIGKHDNSFVCRNCLNSYSVESELSTHQILCGNKNKSVYIPSKESHIKWDKYYQKMPIYSIIIADFEARNEPIINQENITFKTIDVCKQIPSCNGLFVINKINDMPIKTDYYESTFGDNNVRWFLNKINAIEYQMSEFFKQNLKPKITVKSEKSFLKSKFCWLCDINFGNINGKVRHYCKMTGRYLGAGHQTCIDYINKVNLHKFIPVLYHNFSKYDCHMFFNELINSKVNTNNISVIPKTNEEYMSVNYNCIKFLDSMRFLTTSLEKLTESMKDEDYIHLKKHFPDHWILLKNKLAYPYEFYKTLEEYGRPIDELLEAGNEAYFSKTANKIPNQKEINRTNQIIKLFNIKNGRELTQLYNKADVILLADIFEKFIKVSKTEFGINPLYNISLPGTTWSNGLKYTKIELELIKNVDLFQMFESGIRGGISGIFGDRFVESDNNTVILHVDMNNLYGFAMLFHLPTGNFQIYENNSITESFINKVLNTHDCSNTGYILIVDLIYPDNIKYKTKNFPLCPENKTIDPNNYTQYMKEHEPNPHRPTSKLICDQTNKEYYIIHYRNLKFYLRMGMIIKKVHRIVSFDQSPWLKAYIDYNTQKRAQADSDFIKDYHKNLVCSFFGKTMEDVRNRIKLEFVKNTDERTILRYQSRLDFDGIHKSYQDYDSYTFKSNVVKMEKPIYLGFCILELSKLLMYETYYDKLQKYFGIDGIQIHYQDTDAFIMSLTTKDIVNDLSKLQDQYNLFDFSNLNKEHKLFSNDFKKIPGYLKIETPKSLYIDKFVCLRSKCYAYMTQLDGYENKFKGIVKGYKKEISFDQYYNCLMNQTYDKTCEQFCIRSHDHNMYLQKITKKSLSPFDDKRKYINNIQSVPW